MCFPHPSLFDFTPSYSIDERVLQKMRPLLVAVIEYDDSDGPVTSSKLRVDPNLYPKKDLSVHDLYGELVKAYEQHQGDSGSSCFSAIKLPSLSTIQIYDSFSQQYLSLDCCFEDDIVQRFGRRLRLRIIKPPNSTASNKTPLSITGRYYEFNGQLEIAGHCITIQEDSNLRDAGTAINVWDGAILLARYLEQRPSIVRGLSVLELGAGCGLVGIVAGVLGARAVILTDLPTELKRLEQNVNRNRAICSETTVMTCEACDWWDPPKLSHLVSPLISSESTPLALNLILVADCIWVEELVEPLFLTLRQYATRETRILISYQRRGRATDEAFWSALHDLFRSVEEFKPTGFYKPEAFHLFSCRL